MMAQSAAKDAEKKAALAAYQERLAHEPQIQALAGKAEPYHIGEALAFVRDDKGQVVSPLDLAALGLPEFHDSERPPLAIILDTSKETGVVKSVRLLVSGLHYGTSILYLEAENPVFAKDSNNLKLTWQHETTAQFPDRSQEIASVVNDSKVVTVKLERARGEYGSQSDSELSIVRAAVTPEDARLQNPKAVEAKHKKTGKLGKLIAGLALATAVSNMSVPHDAAKPAAVKTFEHDYLTKAPSSAEKATIHARDLFEAGDLASLDALAAKSEFAQQNVGPEVFTNVEQATNFDELEDAMNQAMPKFGGRYTAMRNDKLDEYIGLKPEGFEEAKNTALGILDGINNLGPLMRSNRVSFDIEAVEQSAGKGHKWGGLYVTARGKKPVIQMASKKNRANAAATFEHEEGHHESLTERTINSKAITLLQRSDFKYGPDGSGNGVVGVDIPTEYAGTDVTEQLADMYDGLFGENTKLNSDQKTVLQEEFQGMLASLEEDFPGISAVAYKNALLHQQKTFMVGPETVKSLAEQAREKSALLVLGLVLIEAGLKARYDKTKKQLDDQKAAGVR